MVEVEHSSLCPFKEDFLAFTDIEVRRVVRILDVLADLIGIAEVFFEDFIVIEAFAAIIFFKETVFKVNIDAQFLGKYIAVHEVADADAYAVDFVGIARSDTVFRRADFSTRGNFQFADLHPFGGHAFDFFKEDFRIDNDAAADDASFVGKEDPRRQETQCKGLIVDDDRMAGVIPTLGADDDIGLLGQIIYNLTFTFVAPLGSDYHCCSHVFNIPS